MRKGGKGGGAETNVEKEHGGEVFRGSGHVAVQVSERSCQLSVLLRGGIGVAVAGLGTGEISSRERNDDMSSVRVEGRLEFWDRAQNLDRSVHVAGVPCCC